jgi:hypothetical protein
MLTRAVMGHGLFYDTTIASILLVLALSANTAFADFPRLTRAIALNNFLPHVFLLRGRRLLYSWGIYVLVALTAALLVIFDGVTDRLIPLYAIGAFLAFTLSQSGMVVHWWKKGNSRLRMTVNGVGALATGVTTCVVLVTKFMSGAWITALLIPAMIVVMRAVRRHYNRVERETELTEPLIASHVEEPIVVMPIDRWSRISEKALAFALSLSADVRCLHVQSGDEEDQISKDWERIIVAPLKAANKPVPQLVVLKSPFRYILQPMIDHILGICTADDEQRVCVLVPELMVHHWWENLMHNRRADLLKVLLMVRGRRNVVVINVPWYLDKESLPPSAAPAEGGGHG